MPRLNEVVLLAGRDPRDEPGGGHSSYVRAHALAARAAGYEPRLFAVGRDSSTEETEWGVIHRLASPLGPYRQMMIAAHGPVLAAAIARFAGSRQEPLLIHSFGIWGWAGHLAARRLRGGGPPLVRLLSSYTTYHDQAASKVRGLGSAAGLRSRTGQWAEYLWSGLALNRLERRLYREQRLILVNYESVRRLIVARHGEGLAIRRVPYAAESAFRDRVGFPGSPPPLPLRPEGAPLVVAVSRQDPRKGIDVLLQALALLSRRGVPVRACLVGEGPLLHDHRRHAQRLGLDGSVVLPGLVDDVAPYLRAADVYVLPSRAEQSGSLSLLEALQAGVAIVASACDGIPEDVRDGEEALLVAPGDPEALADGLERLLNDRLLRERLSRNARAAFETRFSAPAFTAALGAVYAELLEASTGR